MNPSRLILTILDGWGIADPGPGNAITLAGPENFNYLNTHYPHSSLLACGTSVGLPDQEAGNSETGHLNLGAGRIVFQDLARINLSIADGSFFVNSTLLSAINHVQKYQSTLHIIGLIGRSGVHAYNDHLFALLLLASRHSLTKVNLHLITDGRDSPPTDSPNQIKLIEEQIKRYQVGRITSLMGRYYALDRDMRLDRTQKAFDCLIGKSSQNKKTALEAIQASYNQNITDEFISPTTIGEQPETTRLKENDALIFYNFRVDRPRQLTKSIIDHHFPNFNFVTMTKYHHNFDLPIVFPLVKLQNTLGETLANQNVPQLRATESEKERFVTFYFNGQNEEPFRGEDRLIVASPKVATYDLQPEMSSVQLVDLFSKRWQENDYRFGLINFPNPDMVAHSGNIEKTVLAIKAVDVGIKRLLELAEKTNSFLLLTADHGNAEELLDPITHLVNTEHSVFPVPFVVYHSRLSPNLKLNSGILADVAPTVLSLLNLEKPPEITGHNLVFS